MLKELLAKFRYPFVVPKLFVQNRNKSTATKNTEPIMEKEDLKKRLTPLQFYVTQEKGTERAFTGTYDKKFEKGLYVCICCNQALFSSDTKYDSGCGWPAFNDVLAEGKVKLTPDYSYTSIFHQNKPRTEVTCSKCNAHLGHVFNDGPQPTRKRFCINSASIHFIEDGGEQVITNEK